MPTYSLLGTRLTFDLTKTVSCAMDADEENTSMDGLANDVPHVPGGLIILPRSSLEVIDVDEEVRHR